LVQTNSAWILLHISLSFCLLVVDNWPGPDWCHCWCWSDWFNWDQV